MSNLVPYFIFLHNKRFEAYSSTRSYITPDGFEYAVISISMQGFETLMETLKSNPKGIKEWVAYWYGGSAGEESKFPKPHHTEITTVRFGLNKGPNEDRCEIQITIQRGHYFLGRDPKIKTLDPKSIPSWPR